MGNRYWSYFNAGCNADCGIRSPVSQGIYCSRLEAQENRKQGVVAKQTH